MKRLLPFILAIMPACASPCSPMIATWEGQSQLAEAEQNRKIKVLESEAVLNSAKNLADAEVLRAQGAATANKIIGDSLKNNESYLRWLWIKGLEDAATKAPSTIYIPTEAGIPILEAGRRPVQ